MEHYTPRPITGLMTTFLVEFVPGACHVPDALLHVWIQVLPPAGYAKNPYQNSDIID